MGIGPVLEALALLSEAGDLLKEIGNELISPEMIRALSPTEGLEVTPHTFQAIESEGRWKKSPDWPQDDPRIFTPPAKKIGKLRQWRATILKIELDKIDQKFIQTIIKLLLATLLPSVPKLATTTNLNQIRSDPMGILAPLGKYLPSLGRALADLQNPSSAEIDAIWWSDGYEIWAGQAAAKHVRGFGSLFGHQARIELNGGWYGNYFPQSYCLTFTGFINPVGPVFQELRGAVLLGADGSAKGLFCERSDRDKREHEPVFEYSADDGYCFRY
jgi:hypothetical protein